MSFEMELVGIVIGVFVFFVVQFLYFQKKNREELEKKLRSEWGRFSEREYDGVSWERLTHYNRNHRGDGCKIDEITWNDLDMDAVFCQMNGTHSSIGEEYLYYLLHTPVTEQEELEERERLISFFSEHERERLTFQMLADGIGKLKKESVSDYLVKLEEAPKIETGKHYASLFALLGSLLLLFLRPVIGIFALILALGYGISLYYKEKAGVVGFMSCFKQVVRILDAVSELKECRAPELNLYLAQMAGAQERLSGLKKLTVFLPGGSVSGSPIDILLDYVRMLTHIDLILFGRMLDLFEAHRKEIEMCMERFGYLESMIAAASYRQALSNYCLPEFLTGREAGNSLCMELTEVYHPCIEAPVTNSIAVNKSVLLTGSNASGKSTFLKTAAIAALLAQTIHTVPASRYRAPFYQIYSSMAIRDNLSGHDSYYMAEIKSLKRILDANKDMAPVLCFIDEVLRGTNTVERIAASTEILKGLARQRVLCFAATHDMELTQLLKEEYENYYFSETLQGEDVVFDYRLKKGTAASRNAIRLIRQLGYDNEIVERALRRAERFLETGGWM